MWFFSFHGVCHQQILARRLSYQYINIKMTFDYSVFHFSYQDKRWAYISRKSEWHGSIGRHFNWILKSNCFQFYPSHWLHFPFYGISAFRWFYYDKTQMRVIVMLNAKIECLMFEFDIYDLVIVYFILYMVPTNGKNGMTKITAYTVKSIKWKHSNDYLVTKINAKLAALSLNTMALIIPTMTNKFDSIWLQQYLWYAMVRTVLCRQQQQKCHLNTQA